MEDLLSNSTALFLCASLADARSRRESFSGNFSDGSLWKFIDSVDGRRWSEVEADSHVSDALQKIRSNEAGRGLRWINPAAIACALTHRDGLLKAAESKSLILCEDDVLIHSDFVECWKEADVRAGFAACDGVVLLHYTSRAPIVAKGRPVLNFGRYSIFKLRSDHLASGACYFAPPQVASSIRNFQTPINVTADDWIAMLDAGVFSSLYAVHPSPCRIEGLASTIGYGSSVVEDSQWAMLARKVNRFLRKRRMKIHDSISAFEA